MQMSREDGCTPAKALEAHGCAKVEGSLLRPRLLGRTASWLRSKGVGAVVGVHLHSRTLSVTVNIHVRHLLI